MLPQDLPLSTEVNGDVGGGVVENDGNVLEGEPELSVEDHLGEACQVGVAVEAVASFASPAGREQTDPVVVVQRPDAHAREA